MIALVRRVKHCHILKVLIDLIKLVLCRIFGSLIDVHTFAEAQLRELLLKVVTAYLGWQLVPVKLSCIPAVDSDQFIVAQLIRG